MFKLEAMKSNILLLFLLIVVSIVNGKTPVVSMPTKLCLNAECSELVFTTTATRAYQSNHQQMLSLEPEMLVKVYGFKFSNRDVFLAEVNGQLGWVYPGFISLEPYFFFLESALKTNAKLYKVEQREDGSARGKVVAELDANPELYRDYQVIADRVQLKPEEIQIVKPAESASHHGHSHGHSHSHDHQSHDHSHVKPEVSTTTTSAPLFSETQITETSAPQLNIQTTIVPITVTSDAPPPVTTEASSDSDVNSFDRPVATATPGFKSQDSLPLGSDNPSVKINPYGSVRLQDVTTTPVPRQVDDPTPEPLTTSTASPLAAADETVSVTPAAPYVSPLSTTLPPETTELPVLEDLNLDIPTITLNPSFDSVDVSTTSSSPVTTTLEYADPLTMTQTTATPLTTTIQATTSSVDVGKNEYCFKGDCSDFESTKDTNKVYARAMEHLENKDDGIIRTGLKSFINGLKGILPYPFDGLDDTGVVMVFFSLFSFVVFIIGRILDDSECPDAFDRRTLFDAKTKITEQAAVIDKLKSNAPSGQQLVQLQEFQQKIQAQKEEIFQLRQRVIDPSVIHEKDRLLADLENEVHRLNSAVRERDNQISELKVERSALEDRVEKIKEEKKILDKKLHDKIAHLQRDLTTSESKLEQLQSILPEKENALQIKETEISKLLDQIRELEEYSVAYSKSIIDLETKLRKAEESGGSVKSGDGGSWSDIDKSEIDKSDIDISHDNETTEGLSSGTMIDSESNVPVIIKKESKVHHTEDIRVLAKANVEVTKLKEEKQALKEEKQALESQLNNEKTTKKALEEKLIDRDNIIVRLNTQIDSLNEELKEKKLEIKEKQVKIEALTEERIEIYKQVLEARNEAKALSSESSRLENEKNVLERAARELEQKLKKAEDLEAKLRTKMFHDERDAQKKIKGLEEKIAHMTTIQISSKTAETGNLSMASNGLFNDVPSLWSPFNNFNTNGSLDESEPDFLTNRSDPRRNLRAGNISPARSTESSGNVNDQRGKSHLTSRDMGRERPEQQTRGTTQRRMRSRSAGRFPREAYPAQQVPSGRMSAGRSGGHISPATSLLHTASPYYADSSGIATLPRPASGGRLPKVPSNLSNLYYSSDGSPPPNLVQRAGIPPVKNVPRPVTVRAAIKLHPPRPQK
ncbi:unnamed protein product [Bursaphelenchus xylophilus]|uniref:(pine wood nematode) hypothetical protein n=1 Tax=Bursaphelenchus xylophilus TaxID=6326 RepID=A0A1I7SDT2_BURXY|nr:unnamed protein product [Bursaphelenchus xylophilus]CAG9084312.1 unnamed protein product [Bursaphelenchus xylophilus]